MKTMLTGHLSKVSTEKPTVPLLDAKTFAGLFSWNERVTMCQGCLSNHYAFICSTMQNLVGNVADMLPSVVTSWLILSFESCDFFCHLMTLLSFVGLASSLSVVIQLLAMQMNLLFSWNFCVFSKIVFDGIFIILVHFNIQKIYYLFLLYHFWQLVACFQVKHSTNILHVNEIQFSHKIQVCHQRMCKDESENN